MEAYREALTGADVEMDGILAYLFQRAIRLETLRDQGAQFSYPDALRAEEWVAIYSLKVARATSQEVEINTQVQEATLERAVKRRR